MPSQRVHLSIQGNSRRESPTMKTSKNPPSALTQSQIEIHTCCVQRKPSAIHNGQPIESFPEPDLFPLSPLQSSRD